MCVEVFDASCSDRAADADARRTGSTRAAPALLRERGILAAGRAHVLRWPGWQLFACGDFLLEHGDFLLEHGARDGSNAARTAQTC